MLQIAPCTLAEANTFIQKYHRHHKPVPGCKFCVAVAQDGEIVGVAVVGRPVSRMLDDTWTLEVNRTCTDGARNANSMLYGACWRAVKALGYKRLVTYSLPEEGGASLRAAGYKLIGLAGGGNWNVRSRPRVDSPMQQQKFRWEKEA